MSLFSKYIGYTNRRNYWSCSKVADRLRSLFGISKKLDAGTCEEWAKWKKENKDKWAYWLTEDGLDYVQDVVLLPHDVYTNIRIYIKNRFVDKLQYLSTNLTPGKYYEVNTRLLHGIFETLVDFVETEKAHMQRISADETDIITGNDRTDGLNYINWEITLKTDSQPQAASALELKTLYLWWKDERPNRPDPYDESGWSAFCEKNNKEHEDEWICIRHYENDEDKKILDILHNIEQRYKDEDTEMLIRVIKLRDSLWT